jgi:hypothetical protein
MEYMMETVKGKDFVRVNGISFNTRLSVREVDERFESRVREMKLFRGFGAMNRFGTRGQFMVFSKSGTWTETPERFLGVLEGVFEEVLYACMRIDDFGRLELVSPTPVNEVFQHIPLPAIA